MPSDKNKSAAAATGAGSDSEGDEEVGEVFEVERILKKRQRNGKTEYLIRWKGFGSEEDSWEPPSNLEGCPEIVEAFEKKLTEKLKQQRKESAGSGGGSGTPAAAEPSKLTTGGKRKSTGGGAKDTPPSAAGAGAPAESKKSKESHTLSIKTGFDRNYEAEKIIGATDSTGELMFLIKWKNLEEAELVPARIANKKCPHTVISFYEERLTWTGPSNE